MEEEPPRREARTMKRLYLLHYMMHYDLYFLGFPLILQLLGDKHFVYYP